MISLHRLPVLLFATIIFFATGCKKDDVTGLPSINSENNKNVGASANALLSANTYSSVKVEIQYMPGFQPQATTVNNMVAFLNLVANKPGGVTVTQTEIASAGNTSLALNDVATIEKNNRTAYTSGSQLAVYVLITDGAYSDPNTLGIAFRNTSICLFGKTIHDNSGSIGQASRVKLESTVLQHEVAHLLGLVDIGSSMQVDHKDASHGNHCNNNACLMYYASETTDVLGLLLTGNIPTLDGNCRADLTANGGK